MRECPQHKARHATLNHARVSAREFAMLLNQSGRLAEDIYAYRCPGCRKWHTTRRAEWNHRPNTLVHKAAPEELQRWAMAGKVLNQDGGPVPLGNHNR